jgi:hypothetical protein
MHYTNIIELLVEKTVPKKISGVPHVLPWEFTNIPKNEW